MPGPGQDVPASSGDDPVTYRDLDHLEVAFEEIDAAMCTYQHVLSQKAYAKRAQVTSRIPRFWALVFEQAPVEIDAHIQPSDSALFASCLRNVEVDRFEISPGAKPPMELELDGSSIAAQGEPRSFSVKFTFDENEWFEDKVLEKRWYYRSASDGWHGRVSEPVRIHWKKDKDLTAGFTDLASDLWDARKEAGRLGLGLTEGNGNIRSAKEDRKGLPELPEYEKLRALLDSGEAEGMFSFFLWFASIGPHPWVTAEESAYATQESRRNLDKHNRKTVKQEEDGSDTASVSSEEDLACEIFLGSDDLAVALAEDLYPNALGYFQESQEEGSQEEADDMDDMDDLDDNVAPLLTEEVKQEDGLESKEPPIKKRKRND